MNCELGIPGGKYSLHASINLCTETLSSLMGHAFTNRYCVETHCLTSELHPLLLYRSSHQNCTALFPSYLVYSVNYFVCLLITYVVYSVNYFVCSLITYVVYSVNYFVCSLITCIVYSVNYFVCLLITYLVYSENYRVCTNNKQDIPDEPQ